MRDLHTRSVWEQYFPRGGWSFGKPQQVVAMGANRIGMGSGWAHDLAHPAPLRRTYAQITEAGCKLFPATPPDKPQRSEGDND